MIIKVLLLVFDGEGSKKPESPVTAHLRVSIRAKGVLKDGNYKAGSA
jgi:hypothetical protein